MHTVSGARLDSEAEAEDSLSKQAEPLPPHIEPNRVTRSASQGGWPAVSSPL